MDALKKIALWTIYAGMTLALATPLFVENGFFFPFITAKAFAFRIIVEIMVLAYLYLAFTVPEYRPRLTWPTILWGLFLVAAIISSLLGPSFSASFWGDMERSDGIFLLTHLLAFLLVLSSVVSKKKNWERLFDFSLGVAILVSLFATAQVAGLESVLRTSGERADAFFGNASFLAGYMIFQIAFAAYFLWRRKSKGSRVYYGALVLFFSWIIFATQTRGAMLGVIGAAVVASLLAMWFYRNNQIVRRGSAAVIILAVLSVGILFTIRNQHFVQDSPLLTKLTSFSLEDRTTETRLATWGAAWDGWKNKFLFGYGIDNFNLVFDKNFPPIIYEDDGSVVWFDRAHNVIFDRGVTTGFFGLALFLSFLFYPMYYLVVHKPKEGLESKTPAIIFSALIAAYFIQDLFVFETITTYILLTFTFAFLSASYLPKVNFGNFKLPQKFWKTTAIIYLILLLPILWIGTLKPASVNRVAAVALNSNPVEDSYETIFNRFKNMLESGTYGQREYRIQFVDFIGTQLGEQGPISPKVMPIVIYAEEQLDRQLAEYPFDAKNYLLAMRFYNAIRDAVPGEEIGRIEKALSYYPKLKELSPPRPHGPQEAGYSYQYLYEKYLEQGDKAKAEESLQKAEELFWETVAINPEVAESYINLERLFFMSNQEYRVADLIEQMENANANYKKAKYLTRMLGIAKTYKAYAWINFFTEELTKVEPENAQAWIDFALSYAYQGQRAEARAVADVIKGFGGDYVREAEIFLEKLDSGYYEKNPL